MGIAMDTLMLVTSFALGSAALAVWLYLRFSSIAPETFRRAALHVCAAVVVGQSAIFGAKTLGDDPVSIMVSLFALMLPTLVYSFLSCLWIFRVCQEMLRGAIR